mmetsp:Transcript_8709/g.23953  ORF Transcript_8709/g.23953 Transcript_8709/m.23953 type:complete len:209 (+) Transcript_8709:78-704(+)
MIVRHCPSISMNLALSVGNCFLISPAPKMLSKYIQFRCTFSHSSNVSWKSMSSFCHFSTSSRIGPTKRLPAIVEIVTRESSSATVMSSTEPTMNTSLLSLYGLMISSKSCQVLSTLASISSNATSAVAFPDISCISSMCWSTFIPSSSPSVKFSSSKSSSRPIIAVICSQCRGFSALFRNATTTGKVFLNCATSPPHSFGTSLSGIAF